MTSEAGRWRGRLTSRPLPDVDETIDALADEERAALVAHWLGRAAAERRASDAFVVIAHDLQEIKADPTLIELATRAVDDELRHAEICRLVAARFAGRDVAAPASSPLDAPKHADAPPSLVPFLHVLGQCAVNETTATAYLEACLARAEGPLVRAALRELLSDDIDHARIGWALLAASSVEVKRALAPFVLPMLRAHVRWWRGPSARTTPRLAAQGALDAAAIDAAIIESMRALVVPGLERIGIPSSATRRWMEAGCAE